MSHPINALYFSSSESGGTNGRLSNQHLDFPSEHKQVLRALVIDEKGPGTILRDFEALLAFLREQEPRVSSKLHLLPLRTLPEVNARLTHPLPLGLERPQQKSYPHIHGLYLSSCPHAM